MEQPQRMMSFVYIFHFCYCLLSARETCLREKMKRAVYISAASSKNTHIHMLSSNNTGSKSYTVVDENEHYRLIKSYHVVASSCVGLCSH
jgi:hypothetical protein